MRYERLTTPQKNIWNLQKYYMDTAIANQCGAIIFDDKRNTGLLKKAIQTVIKKQTGLRLRFVEKEEAMQYVSESGESDIPVKVFATEAELDQFADSFAKAPIGLTNCAQYRFVVFELKKRSGVLVVLSHLISDAWTFGLLAKEVDYAYQALEKGELEDFVETDYFNYVEAEKQYLSSEKFEKDAAYWSEKYAARPEKTSLKEISSISKSIEAKRIVKELPIDLENKINKFCKEHSVTQAVLFETALITYLYHINPENHSITIGIPVLNRCNAKEKEIAGMFISTMPLTIAVEENISAVLLARKISAGHMSVFRHQKYPYELILKELRETQNFDGNLYEVMFSYQNAVTKTSAQTKWYSNGYSEVPFTMHIDNRDGKESHTMTIDYQTAVFGQAEEVELSVQRIWYILGQICDDPNEAIAEIDIAPQKEKGKILIEFNDTYVEYPKEKCVHEFFEQCARISPNRLALCAGSEQLTYCELDKKANALAKRLITLGVSKGGVIGAYLDRTAYTVISQLAVLKAGGVFLPIDHRYPKDRIDYMLKDCKVKLVLTDQELSKAWNVEYLNLKKYNFDDILTSKVKSKPEDECYVIYTSGSTGKPKGCVLKHSGIANFCENNNIVAYAESLDHQTVVSVNTISFDFFIAETLLPLSQGWTVVLASEEESNHKELFSRLVRENKVNIIETTPTRLEMYTKGETEDSYFKQIQLVVSSGEALSQPLFQRIRKISNAKVFNPLGPSECSVWNAGGNFKEDITIGKPIANTQIYILDKNNNPVPIGVAGELCIAGAGVGKGYLNRPDLTAEKFVPNPFATEANHHGKVMYHTGDLARWRADGEIEYLGRIDTQVKIRGLRIELGEIESVMSSYEGIQLAAVADKRDENNRQYLVGYYTTGEAVKIDERDLRKRLADKLPKYMIPNYFVHLDKLPMTASGKTDRKNLPEPDLAARKEVCVEPETEQEIILCELLQEILGMEKVGVNYDFFEYGGDSLRAIEYVAQAHGRGIEIALQNVFDHPSVRELCDFLNRGAIQKVAYQTKDFEKYNEIFERNIIESEFIPVRQELGNILLTGATGFLGAHVLDELLKTESGKVYCLVRSNGQDDRRGRLRDILQYYFGDKYEREFGKRIIPIVGDIEYENLAENMPLDVQTVIHTAASVKHYGSYAYFHKVNVEGTRNVVDYAKQVGARMIHISTLSVSGNSMADDFTVYRSREEKHFYETSLYIGQPLDNVYIHSKFEAERQVYDAMLEGLDAMVIRVGNLTNRATDYKFQPNYKENAFLMRVKALLEFGLFPDYLLPLYAEFSPIDKTAEGIVRIAQYARRQTVFHLNSNKVLHFNNFLEIVHKLGIQMRIVDGITFNNELQKTIQGKGTEYIFEAFQNDMDEDGRLIYDSNIHIENSFTLWFLEQIGFKWNETDFKYLSGYVEYFRNLGYLEV